MEGDGSVKGKQAFKGEGKGEKERGGRKTSPVWPSSQNPRSATVCELKSAVLIESTCVEPGFSEEMRGGT